MTLVRFGFNIPSFTYSGIDDADLFDAVCAAAATAEHIAYGYDFPPAGDRMNRLEDAVRICRAMFDGGPANVSGAHHRVAGALNRPRPLNSDGPPILVGGGGERRTLQIAARHADACNIFGRGRGPSGP